MRCVVCYTFVNSSSGIDDLYFTDQKLRTANVGQILVDNHVVEGEVLRSKSPVCGECFHCVELADKSLGIAEDGLKTLRGRGAGAGKNGRREDEVASHSPRLFTPSRENLPVLRSGTYLSVDLCPSQVFCNKPSIEFKFLVRATRLGDTRH
jgi:hypothetical protein